MKRYRVQLNGQNFQMRNGEVLGFYTTRWVKAHTPEMAEKAAVKLVREDPSLKAAVNNKKDNPPMIYLENLAEVGWFEFLRRNPGAGYTFYPDQEDESSENDSADS